MQKAHTKIEEIKEMTLFDGLCPECMLDNVFQEMWLQEDIFECPCCHLMVALDSWRSAVILRRRGPGHFKSLQDTRYCATHCAHDYRLLCRESHMFPFREEPGSGFISGEDLREYLRKVRGFGEHV